jgi:hypothetical protein
MRQARMPGVCCRAWRVSRWHEAVQNFGVKIGTHKGCRYMIHGYVFVAAALVAAIVDHNYQGGS